MAEVDQEIYQNDVPDQCETNHTCETVFNSKKKL